jgi:hypothetical protein
MNYFSVRLAEKPGVKIAVLRSISIILLLLIPIIFAANSRVYLATI